ncbi:hypothetical protein ACOME3_000970 [Neoechinorhynchus agilis]
MSLIEIRHAIYSIKIVIEQLIDVLDYSTTKGNPLSLITTGARVIDRLCVHENRNCMIGNHEESIVAQFFVDSIGPFIRRFDRLLRCPMKIEEIVEGRLLSAVAKAGQCPPLPNPTECWFDMSDFDRFLIDKIEPSSIIDKMRLQLMDQHDLLEILNSYSIAELDSLYFDNTVAELYGEEIEEWKTTLCYTYLYALKYTSPFKMIPRKDKLQIRQGELSQLVHRIEKHAENVFNVRTNTYAHTLLRGILMNRWISLRKICFFSCQNLLDGLEKSFGGAEFAVNSVYDANKIVAVIQSSLDPTMFRIKKSTALLSSAIRNPHLIILSKISIALNETKLECDGASYLTGQVQAIYDFMFRFLLCILFTELRVKSLLEKLKGLRLAKYHKSRLWCYEMMMFVRTIRSFIRTLVDESWSSMMNRIDGSKNNLSCEFLVDGNSLSLGSRPEIGRLNNKYSLRVYLIAFKKVLNA